MERDSGGYQGPSWADFWLSAASVEKELRARVVVRLSGSKVVKRGSVVELFIVRYLTRTRTEGIAHVDALFPSKHHKTLPACLLSLLYLAHEEAARYDSREHRELTIEDLPVPPPADL